MSKKGFSKGNTKGAQATIMEPCHEDAVAVFHLGSAEVWAGARTEILCRWGWTALVSALTSIESPKCPVAVNEDGKKFFPDGLWNYKPPPILSIAWPDMGIPSLGKSWWKLLAKTIAEKEGKVGIYCQGGHGRTGTALAILGSLGGVIPAKGDPVEWVRDRYCEKACESNDQMDYVELITGRTVLVACGKSPWYSFAHNAGAGAGTAGKPYTGV